MSGSNVTPLRPELPAQAKDDVHEVLARANAITMLARIASNDSDSDFSGQVGLALVQVEDMLVDAMDQLERLEVTGVRS